MNGCAVWVAHGTYKVTTTTIRSATIQLRQQTALYGGFAGNETTFGTRDFATNETILSGDIGTAGDNSDNSNAVVSGADYATLDGFTVTGANGTAGLSSPATSLTVNNCNFRIIRAVTVAGGYTVPVTTLP